MFTKSIHFRCLLSNVIFAVFTDAPEETAELFTLRRQDWMGLYVVLLNPTYHEHVIRKNVMKLFVKEIFLPITDPAKYARGWIDQIPNPLLSTVKEGPMPFLIRTGNVRVEMLIPSLNTCGNLACDGRHVEGTRCAIPPKGQIPAPIVGFCAIIRLPSFPYLGPIQIDSTAFALLFCTEKFLNKPFQFDASYKPAKKTVERAFKFYNKNGYRFELGGVLFGVRVEEGEFAVRKAVASYFKVVKRGRLAFAEKFDV
jgi:hypothetical protein